MLGMPPEPATPQPRSFERELRICGVDVLLRVCPALNTFVFTTSRELNSKEKLYFAEYLKSEGFLDDPETGESVQGISI